MLIITPEQARFAALREKQLERAATPRRVSPFDEIKKPRFSNAREKLEWRLRRQFRIDRANGAFYRVPIEYARRHNVPLMCCMLSLSDAQLDELARDLANYHARRNVNRYYQEILPEKKRRLGKAL